MVGRRWYRTAAGGLAALTGLLLVSACQAPATGTPSVPPTSVATPPPTPALPTTPPTSPDASAFPSPTGTPSPGASPEASPATSPGPSPTAPERTPALIQVPPGSPTTLELAQAFDADGWVMGTYQVAGKADRVAGWSSVVNCNQAAGTVEFRFAPASGTVRFQVAQDVMSDSSDNTLEYTLVLDGKAVVTKTVTFKQSAELSAPLTGVTVVKLQVRTKGTCKNNSTALVTGATASG